MTTSRHVARPPEPGPEGSGDRIQVLRPLLPSADRLLSYLRRIDASRTYTNWGPLASEFESRLASHFGLAPGTVTSASSGTDALVGAILATAGRATAARPLALVPAFTFIATALAVEQCGFRPHLVDVDPTTWQLDADVVRRHPTLNQVGLVVPVAPFGRAVPQEPWQEFCRTSSIPVVVDGGASFEALSADPHQFIRDIPVALSFHATKSFSTAEGGCVISTAEGADVRIARAMNFGFFETRECATASTNGKMSEYHAAIGLAELDGWAAKLDSLGRVARNYRQLLDADGLGEQLYVAPEVASCYALLRCLGDAETVLQSLERSGVETRCWYGRGLHQQPYLVSASRDSLPVTDHLTSQLIGLPVAPDLSETQVRRIAEAAAWNMTGYR